MDLLQRIERLEHRNRRPKLIGLGLLLLVAVVALEVQVGKPQPAYAQKTSSAPLQELKPAEQTGEAIQTAIDSLPPAGGRVNLPPGTYLVKKSIRLKNNIILQGSGFSTVLKSDPPGGLTSPIICSGDPANRSYGLFVRDLAIDCIDWTQVSVGGIENVSVANVKTGILVKGAAFYNSFINVLVSNADIGMDFTPITTGANASGANENRVIGARMVEVDVGFDIESDNIHFFQCSVEGPFSRGFRLKPNVPERSYTDGIGIYGARFETSPRAKKDDYGIEIGSGVTRTTIVAPYFARVSIPVKDYGSSKGTVILGDGKAVLSSPNGSLWEMGVDNAGKVTTKRYP
jgi:hypothetical protein